MLLYINNNIVASSSLTVRYCFVFSPTIKKHRYLWIINNVPDQSPDFGFCFKHIYMWLVVFLPKVFFKLLSPKKKDPVWVSSNVFHCVGLGKEWDALLLPGSLGLPLPSSLTNTRHGRFSHCHAERWTEPLIAAICVSSRQTHLLFTVQVSVCAAANGLLLSFCFIGYVLIRF